MNRVSRSDQIQTLRVFLNNGDCFVDGHAAKSVTYLMDYENRILQTDSDVLSPASWLLNNVLPNTDLSLLDKAFWHLCLISALAVATNSQSSVFGKIVESCDSCAIRSGLLWWTDVLVDTFRSKRAL